MIKNQRDEPVDAQEFIQTLADAVVEALEKPETYTMPMVGKFFSVHPQTARRWVKRGVLPPPAIKVGRTVRWSRAQLEEVLAGGLQYEKGSSK